jgi:SpoVK/Ycf46/Vps4 family AAA+-type ATPase
LKKTPIADDVDIPTLAEKTDGFTGAELASIVREAALAAMQEDMNAQNVQMKHFVSVIQGLTTRTITKEMMNFFTQFSAVK